MERTKVLLILGIADTNHIRVDILRAPPRTSAFTYLGNVETKGLFDPDLFDVRSLLCGAMQGETLDLSGFDVLFNAVCDPDTNTKALKVVSGIAKSLVIPVVNHPDAVFVTTRDLLCRELTGVEGLRVPWTVRIAPRYLSEVVALIDDGTLPPPFLFREAGSHGGEQLVAIENADQVHELERFAFDGRDFYVTEFVDFRSSDGLYRKYRILLIDGVAYPKHLIVADDWNIHAESRDGLMKQRPELDEEEGRFLAEFTAARYPAFEAVATRLDLDYFGIDCNIVDDGTVVLFEANACMRALSGSSTHSQIPSHQDSTANIRRAISDLLTRRVTVG